MFPDDVPFWLRYAMPVRVGFDDHRPQSPGSVTNVTELTYTTEPVTVCAEAGAGATLNVAEPPSPLII